MLSTKRKLFVSVNRFEPPHHYIINRNQKTNAPFYTPLDPSLIEGLSAQGDSHCNLTEELRRKYFLHSELDRRNYSQNRELDYFKMYRKQLFIIMLNGDENRSIGFEYLPHLECDELSTDYHGVTIDCVGRSLNDLFMDRDYARFYSNKLK
jgi:hypothetical protein